VRACNKKSSSEKSIEKLRWKAKKHFLQVNLYRLLTFGFFLALWEYASGPWIKPFFISSPSAILGMLFQWISDGSLFSHLKITIIEMVAGFILGCGLAVGAGFILGLQKTLAEVVTPYITALYGLPRIAIAPLFVIWFGIEMPSKIALVTVVIFFLVFFNVFTGVRDVSPELLKVIRLMGANSWQLFIKVIVPSTYVWIFTAMKIAVPRALIAAVVGEMISANRGLGFLVAFMAGNYDTTGILAAIFVLVILAVSLTYGIRQMERRFSRWKSAS
jgi:NitT/TauT family transport system permease protein